MSSDSFKVYILDPKGNLINYVESDLFLTMRYGKQLIDPKVTPGAFIVGEYTPHTFTFKTPVSV